MLSRDRRRHRRAHPRAACALRARRCPASTAVRRWCRAERSSSTIRTARRPGLWMDTRKDCAIVLLPGPPREMTPMLDAVIFSDRLRPRAQGARPVPAGPEDHRTSGIGSRRHRRTRSTAQWITQPVPISTTILAVLGQIELHLTAVGGKPRRLRTRRSSRPLLELQTRAWAVDVQRRRQAARSGRWRHAASEPL